MLPSSHPDVLSYIQDTSNGARHATLLDPANQSPQVAAERAQIAVESGTSLLMVGGSTDTPDEKVHATVQAIQEVLELRSWGESQSMEGGDGGRWSIPIVLFPGGSHALSPAADAITFMMLMNSEDPKYLIQEQMRGAPHLAKYGIEALPTGYVVCSPGGKVGEVGRANLIMPDDTSGISAYAQCGAMFGFKLLYLEAGSGADTPVSANLIDAAASIGGLTLFVGGGIRDGEGAKSAVTAGADWIVTGTLTESCDSNDELREKMTDLISSIN